MAHSTVSNAAAGVDVELGAELRRVFDAQHAVALRLRESTVSERLAKLRRLRTAILAHREALIEAVTADLGRPALETELAELLPLLTDLAHHRRHLKRWLRPKRVNSTLLTFGTRASVCREPRGRTLIVSPWNYPVVLTLGPLIPAVACGNTVMLKTSEIAPHSSRALVHLIREVFDETEVAVFEGDASVAGALLELPFDHIFFTGSPAVGQLVMSAAARHLASVTLELGGKSPAIIDAEADLAHAVDTIAWAKCLNAGQTCIAPDHLFVHADIHDQVLERFRQRLREWYGVDAEHSPDFARIVNVHHTRRLVALLEDACARGATVLHGGHVDVPQRFVSPTLLGGIPADARIMHEEIFGPLLPLIVYRHEDELLEQLNARPKPLALYVWTRRRGFARRLLRRTSAGGTCVNHVALQFLQHNLPFGGVNRSGIGSYHGEWGIRAFSHERAVVDARVQLMSAFFPPYRARTRRMAAVLMKWLS